MVLECLRIIQHFTGKVMCTYFFILHNINIAYLEVYNIFRVSYRVAPPPHSKATRIGAELVGAAMWWWVLWHLWHEHEHITVSIFSKGNA